MYMAKKVLIACMVNDQNQLSLLTALHVMEIQQLFGAQTSLLFHFTNTTKSALEHFKNSDCEILICVAGSVGLPSQFVKRSIEGPPFILGSFTLPVIDYEQAYACVKKQTEVRPCKFNVDLATSATPTFYPGYMTLKNKDWGPLLLFKIDRSVLSRCPDLDLEKYDGTVIIDTSVTASIFGEVGYVGCVGQRQRLRG